MYMIEKRTAGGRLREEIVKEEDIWLPYFLTEYRYANKDQRFAAGAGDT